MDVPCARLMLSYNFRVTVNETDKYVSFQQVAIYDSWVMMVG